MVEITLNDILTLNDVEVYNKKDFSNIQNVIVHISNGNVAFKELKDDYPLYMDISRNFDLNTFNELYHNSKLPNLLISIEDYSTTKDLNTALIIVPNVNKAYGELAKIWRKKLNTIFISITGSNGKTTTKEIISHIFSENFYINKTIRNSNNLLGVSNNVLRTREHHRYSIIEHGTNHFGEIEETADIVVPEYALITNIGKAHTEFLIDKEHVFEEKKSLWKYPDTVLFVNNDDDIIRKNIDEFNNEKFTYGFNYESDITGKIISKDDQGRYKFNIKYKNVILMEIGCHIPGISYAKNLLAAITIAIYFKISPEDIGKGLKHVTLIDKRNYFLELKNFTIIDDTYNSSPESVESSIELLSEIVYDKKILILGDMLELGEDKIKDHEDIAKWIMNSDIKIVYTIGDLMKHLHNKIKDFLQSIHYNTTDDFIHSINISDYKDRLILIKGSRGLKMDKIVQSLINTTI